MSKRLSVLVNGIIKENPVLVLILGICPTLAVSTQAENAIGMGLATTFVLLGSNVAVSILRKIIPDKVRIPCYIVFIAGFTTIVKMVVEAYAYNLYQALGIFLPLITVNCIVLGRAEMFANKNSVLDSTLDAIGMGAGFTLALFAMASIREIFGGGTWFGIELPVLINNNIAAFSIAPGGFVVFGLLIAFVNKFSKGKAIKRSDFGCDNCPSAASCGKTLFGSK
jgi:electron transport complex protein RnfE